MPKRPAFVSTAHEPARDCPACGRRQDAATSVDLDAPAARRGLAVGDIGICGYCAAVIVVDTNGFRLATAAEFARLDPVLQQVLIAHRNRSIFKH